MSAFSDLAKKPLAAPLLAVGGLLLAFAAWSLPVNLKALSPALLREAGAGTPTLAQFGRQLVDSEKIGPAAQVLAADDWDPIWDKCVDFDRGSKGPHSHAFGDVLDRLDLPPGRNLAQFSVIKGVRKQVRDVARNASVAAFGASAGLDNFARQHRAARLQNITVS